MTRLVVSALAGLALAAAANSGIAEAQYYKGKTLTILINYPPGGPNDIEGRIVGRHIAKHIPGEPTIVVKNMAGGAGNIGINFMGESAPKDGTTMAFFTWNPLDQILQSEGLRFKYEQFDWVAGVQQPVVVYARRDTAPGLKEPRDIVKAAPFKAGALAPASHGTLRMTMSLDLLGVNYRLVAGYKGLKEVETAVQQNEVQLSNSSLPGWRASIDPTMLKTGIVMPLYHFDSQTADGRFVPSPALPDVKTFLQLYKEVKGADAMPSGPTWDALVLINSMIDSMFRVAFLPPGTNKDALGILRTAFADLWKDEAFMADYEKTVRTRAGLVVGPGAESAVRALAEAKPATVAFIRDYVAKIERQN